ncbi:MAG: hypothetical protein LBC76_06680 [Treponema sp.]|jgi:hypothetical protein|nr:hypothetical protein [Treponema sp.]
MKFNFKFKLKPDKKTGIIAVIAAALIIPLFIFYIRLPVLILTELSFIELYGKERLKKETFFASLALFRPVKIVAVANDAGEDIVPFAVTQASIKPYCVLFPLRFAGSARLYRNLGLNVPIVVLEGRYSEEENPAESVFGEEKSEYFIFKTDINDDFYRTGLAVTAIKPKFVKKQEESANEDDKKGKIIVFLDYKLDKMKDVFLRGLYDRGELYETHFFNSFPQYSEFTDLHCVVMAGVGSEFLEKKAEVPAVLFTWLDPALLPFDAVMTVNDSPLAQVRRAVKMVGSGVKRGLIKSEFRVLNKSKFSKKVIAIIKKNR